MCLVVFVISAAARAESLLPPFGPRVIEESEGFTLLPPDNGSGPLWPYTNITSNGVNLNS